MSEKNRTKTTTSSKEISLKLLSSARKLSLNQITLQPKTSFTFPEKQSTKFKTLDLDCSKRGRSFELQPTFGFQIRSTLQKYKSVRKTLHEWITSFLKLILNA